MLRSPITISKRPLAEVLEMFMRVVHPGIILKNELDELGINPTEFARQIRVPPNRISQIVAGKRSVTSHTALRFGHWFGTDPQFWLNLQTQFDLANANKEFGEEIRQLLTKDSLGANQNSPIPANRRQNTNFD